MKVTALKPVERPDYAQTAFERMKHTNGPQVKKLTDAVHRVPSPQEQEEDSPPDFSMDPERTNEFLVIELTSAVSSLQNAIAGIEAMENAMNDFSRLTGQTKKAPVGMSPEKAKEFREKLQEFSNTISSKTKESQLFSYFVDSDGTLKPSKAKEQFDSFLNEGLSDNKLSQDADTDKQIKDFDLKLQERLKEIRRFKKLLAKRLEEKIEETKQIGQNAVGARGEDKDKSPKEKIRTTIEAIANKLADTSLLYKDISPHRSAYLLK